MATKKCPKCGEENPAEAVMCWACYTPLAGGAAAATAGGLVAPRGGAAAVAPAATAARQEEEKKAIDPRIFLVVGLLVVAGIIGGFTTGVFGGGGNSEVLPAVTLTQGGGGRTRPAGGGTTINVNPSSPVVVSPPTNSGPGNQRPVAINFKTIVPPNPKYTNGTMAILAPTANISPTEALALAKHARQLFAPNGRWTQMQILVFNNPDAAKAFQKYQADNKDAPLTDPEYQDLAGRGIWGSVPAYYETKGKAERAFSPSTSANGWWSRALN